MVLYFSGTGNSEFVAKSIAKNIGEKIVSFNELIAENNFRLEFNKNENMVIVFPIYAWQPPKFILDYLKQAEIIGEPTISAIATCGQEVGRAMKVLRKTLSKKQLRLRNYASVSMPDNCITLFDVESQAEIDEKVENCKEFVTMISQYILEGKSFQTVKSGGLPFVKSYVVNPIFRKFMMSSKPFYADENCINCGQCVEMCPFDNIQIVDNKVVFGKNCVQCLACINRCPFKAIQYGNKTKERGRYVFKE